MLSYKATGVRSIFQYTNRTWYIEKLTPVSFSSVFQKVRKVHSLFAIHLILPIVHSLLKYIFISLIMRYRRKPVVRQQQN